ncbi:MAG: thiamine pyrophosphate-binding protein, partial [Betaproteobacteria bacterium]
MVRSGGRILVDNLLAQGVDLAFCVPGESYLPVLDALYESRASLRLIVCRHEGGASYMGEAYGKLTGRPGIVFVTRGPGASNAAIGIHTAQQDSTPLIVFVGQVGSDFVDREAFQEIDYRRMYGSTVKWAAQIDRPDRIPEYVARAFRVAMSGRPGPVVLALPEDMLSASAQVLDDAPVASISIPPAQWQIDALRSRLAEAKNPLAIVGGSGWDVSACAALADFAQANALPVACAFRNQDIFDNAHANYAGDVGIGINPKLAARVRSADVLLVIGERLGEMVTGGYTLL